MAESTDMFLANVDGEIYAIRSGDKVYGIAGADGQAEAARQAAELARETAEAARVEAEGERDEAEQQRAADQAKNNADQALNNQRMQVLYPRVLTTGEYDPDTLEPTIEDPEVGRQYLVPLMPPVTALSLSSAEAEAAEAGNAYVEWMWVQVGESYSWEKMGVSQMEVTPISTDTIDEVVADENPQGSDTLTTVGLSYFWSKLKAWATGALAAKSHTHAEADVTGLSDDLQGIRDSISPVRFTPQPNTDLNSYLSYATHCFRSGDTLFFHFSISFSQSRPVTGENLLFFTLPEGYRPTASVSLLRMVQLLTTSGGIFYRSATVATTGRVTIDSTDVQDVARLMISVAVDASDWGI